MTFWVRCERETSDLVLCPSAVGPRMSCDGSNNNNNNNSSSNSCNNKNSVCATAWKKTMTWILLLICWQLEWAESRPHFKYMTNYCSKQLQLNESLMMALTPEDSLPEERTDRDFVHCAVDLLAPQGSRLFAHFLQLSISPVIEHTDRLHLYDMLPKKRDLTPVKGLYGKLDRSLFIFDDSGSEIDDYKTDSNRMKLDYLGKPTTKTPGFRVMITVFQAPDPSGSCPSRQFLCQRPSICVSRQVTCDGYPDCGKDETGDEEGCELDEMVTDLLAEYSLARDIIVVVLLPLIVFILIVVVIFLLAKRYIRTKINKPPLPAVSFTPKKGGRVTIAETRDLTLLYAPPSYDDVPAPPPQYGPPPAYSRLDSMVKSGSVELVYSEDDVRMSNRANERRQRQLKNGITESMSSIDECLEGTPNYRTRLGNSEYENYRLHEVWPSDTDDDEEMKAKRRKKGGKSKSKGKRRADTVGGAKSSINGLSNGLSPLASPSSNSAHSGNSATSGPNDDTADSSNPCASSPDLPPTSRSPSQQSFTNSHRRPYPHHADPTDEFIPIHARKSGNPSVIQVPCEVEISPESQTSETSSSNDVGQKSETESQNASKTNSQTESVPSLKDVSSSPKHVNGNGGLSESDEDKWKAKGQTSAGVKPFHTSQKSSGENGMAEDADVSSDSDGTNEIAKLKGKRAPKVTKGKTANDPLVPV